MSGFKLSCKQTTNCCTNSKSSLTNGWIKGRILSGLTSGITGGMMGKRGQISDHLFGFHRLRDVEHSLIYNKCYILKNKDTTHEFELITTCRRNKLVKMYPHYLISNLNLSDMKWCQRKKDDPMSYVDTIVCVYV